MIVTASVAMTKADLDSLTDADLRWLENEVSRRLKERLKHATWFDGGYLGNGHCSFMWARNGAGACCCLPHGHEGPHKEDSQSDASAKP